jgi:hypothetical protein
MSTTTDSRKPASEVCEPLPKPHYASVFGDVGDQMIATLTGVMKLMQRAPDGR